MSSRFMTTAKIAVKEILKMFAPLQHLLLDTDDCGSPHPAAHPHQALIRMSPPPLVAQHVCLSSSSLQCWESLKFKSLFLTLGYVTKAATLGHLCAEFRHCLEPFALTL